MSINVYNIPSIKLFKENDYDESIGDEAYQDNEYSTHSHYIHHNDTSLGISLYQLDVEPLRLDPQVHLVQHYDDDEVFDDDSTSLVSDVIVITYLK